MLTVLPLLKKKKKRKNKKIEKTGLHGLVDCMILLSSFQAVTWMSRSKNSFLAQLDFGTPCLGSRSRINRHFFNCLFSLNRFPLCFYLFVLLFLKNPCLVVAVQPCME